MFCIAAFIILVVMAAFSARYRRYVGTAWNCTWRRVTFRPCDTTFKQDIKDHLLAPVAARRPGLVKPASIGLEILAVLVLAHHHLVGLHGGQERRQPLRLRHLQQAGLGILHPRRRGLLDPG